MFKFAPKTTVIDLPDITVIGRETLVEALHSKIVESEKVGSDSHPLRNLSVIVGPGGTGKSSLAIKYAQQYKTYHKFIAWINGETKQSVTDSFVSVAQNLNLCPYILEKRTWTCSLSDLDIKSLVNCVYRHCTSHMKKSLFIFDNISQIGSSEKAGINLFGIQVFLSPAPEEVHDPPFFLVTSNSTEEVWRELAPQLSIFELPPLTKIEAWQYLVKTIGVASDASSGHVRQGITTGIAATKLALLFVRGRLLAVPGLVISGIDLYHMGDFETSLRKLVGILNGHPLSMYLAKSKINEDWMTSGFTVVRYKVLNKLVQDYTNQLRITMDDLLGSRKFEKMAPSDDYSEFETLQDMKDEEVLDIVLTVTVNQIKFLSTIDKETNVELSKLALRLYDIIAYLPRDCVSVELCYMIYRGIPLNDFVGEMSGQKESEMGNVKKALEILEKYGIISIDNEEKEWKLRDGGNRKFTQVRVQRMVQKWRRNYLERVKDDCECLKSVQDYFERNCDNSIADSMYVLDYIRNGVE